MEVAEVYHADTRVESVCDSTDVVMDLLHSDFEIDLSGISITMVGRDSVRMDADVAPVIRIDRARVTGSSGAAAVKQTMVSASDVAVMSEASSVESSSRSVAEVEHRHQQWWTVCLLMVLAVGGLYLMYRIRSPT